MHREVEGNKQPKDRGSYMTAVMARVPSSVTLIDVK